MEKSLSGHALRKRYDRPCVSRIVIITDKYSLLSASIVDDTVVRIEGQEVETFSFEGPTFNHEWN